MEKLIFKLTGGYSAKTLVDDFTIVTDYPVEYGGEGKGPSPMALFLSSIISCQGTTIRNYCAENGIEYSDIILELIPQPHEEIEEYFPNFKVNIKLPNDFPQEHASKVIEAAQSCPVQMHLTNYKVEFNYELL